MTYLFLFIFGLAIGSFLNVVSLRYRPEQKLLDLKIIGGRSACPHCQKTLRWYELIPLLSFIVQFGKCRSCGQRLSLQYPLVEILTGLIFVFVPYLLSSILNSQFSILIAVWLLIFILFLLLSIIDFRHYIIPDSINLSLAVLGVVLIIFKSMGQWSVVSSQMSFLGHYALLFDLPFFSIFDSSLFVDSDIIRNFASVIINHLFAAIIAMAFFAAIIILTRGRAMGWGDFKLVGALGLIFGWPDILMIIFLSFIVGAVCVTPLLIRKQKTMKDAVPFGPFLIAGSALIFFFGYNIIDGYFKLFGL